MAFPHDGVKFKAGESGNPAGLKKGTKHITTHIQELLEDESFEIQILQGYEIVDYKGAPIKAILQAQLRLALNSKDETTRIKATELLMKHGYSQKIENEHSGEQKLIIETRKHTDGSDTDD